MSANSGPVEEVSGPSHTTKPAGVRVQVKLDGELIADTRDAIKLEETTIRRLLHPAQRREDGPARPLEASNRLPLQRHGVVLLPEERRGERGLDV